MKRLAIFCDGTWNRMAADEPTNVLLAAQAVLSTGAKKVPQVVHYNEGVGTSFVVNEWVETRLAGAFGWSLFDKVADAYRFLIFNYEPGDEIFIFGFSRGAFTARSLGGLLRKCGIIPRASGRDIKKAFDFYQLKAVAPDDDQAQQFRMTYSPQTLAKDEDRAWRVAHGADPAQVAATPLLDIRYIGVWDTVEALGLPKHLHLSNLTGRIGAYEFHDARLSSTVHSARHAVATDEMRRSFEPTLWDNLPLLNGATGKLYEQMWFPGNHGSVGGGGSIRGLSDNALLWILEGAQKQGLAFDPALITLAQGRIDNAAPLSNVTKEAGPLDWIYRKAPRPAPAPGDVLAPATIARMQTDDAYRPEPLKAWWPGQPITIGNRRRSGPLP
ncbi:MAG: DUF2235 domain-containing protein [Candidatus Devosia phytovorans]|uniref:DUF2235 domain-containing protein n=1 Tax=Candidatus Devosia phytovorans TaxID=3121372 RepID=A0AAJ5VS49_9HYPH|nr:DUF2235 domain-containing protein [Devosia sp.]WEK03806.1 MAG: DUF2235 domain-containing protein [Devosia sp.]